VKKAIFLDFDGTLIDSSIDLANSINYMLQTLNKPTFEIELIRSWIGGGATKLVKKALDESGVKFSQKALDIFLDHYSQNLTKNTIIYDNVLETLEVLKKDYILTLITNKPYKFTLPILEEFKMDYFKIILGGDSLEYKKPHPQPLIHCMEKLNLDVNECIMVGDSKNDIEAAKNCNMQSVLVTYGYDNEQLDATYKINNFKDLIQCLK
jgi:phosphoglycolate phosphatase